MILFLLFSCMTTAQKIHFSKPKRDSEFINWVLSYPEAISVMIFCIFLGFFIILLKCRHRMQNQYEAKPLLLSKAIKTLVKKA